MCHNTNLLAYKITLYMGRLSTSILCVFDLRKEQFVLFSSLYILCICSTHIHIYGSTYAQRYLQINFFQNRTSCQPNESMYMVLLLYFVQNDSVCFCIRFSHFVFVTFGIWNPCSSMNRNSFEGTYLKICHLLCLVFCFFNLFFTLLMYISWPLNKLAAR